MIADARKKEQHEEELAENERAFSNGFPNAAIDAKEIHQENVQRIAKMSSKEIEEARQSLFQMMSPEAIAILTRKKKKKKEKKVQRENELLETFKGSLSKSFTAPSINSSIELSSLKTESELLEIARNKKRPMLDRAKLDWTKDVLVPVTDRHGNQTSNTVYRSEMRFDLDGLVVKPNDDPQQLKGLHHHGRNPSSAGYAIDELLHLSRSTQSQQRTMALKALCGILKNRAMALSNNLTSSSLVNNTTLPIIPMTLPIETHVVLHMAIQYVSSQHSNNTLLRTSVNAMHAFLIPPNDEEERRKQFTNWSSTSVGHVVLPPMLHAQHDAKFFRLDTDSHPIDEVNFFNKKEEKKEKEQDADDIEAERILEHQKGAERPVYWLMKNGLIDHISKIMRICDNKTIRQCLDIVTFCARHSMLVASVISFSSIVSTIRDISLEVPIGSKNNNFDNTLECLSLVRILCSSSRLVVERFQKIRILDVVYKYLLTDSNDLYIPIQVRIESLNILRVCLEYHHDVMTCVRILINGENYLGGEGGGGSSSSSSSSGDSSNDLSLLRVTYLNLLETLCRSNPNKEENDQVTHYIHSRMEWLTNMITSDWKNSSPSIIGSVFHVLASAVQSGRIKNIHVERLLRSKHVVASMIGEMARGVVKVGGEEKKDNLKLSVFVLLHGLYRALCISTTSRDLNWTKMARGIISATLQQFISNGVDVSDTRGYIQRPKVHTILMLAEYLSMKGEKGEGITIEMKMNFALIILPMLMPGDEHYGRYLLSDILFNIDHLHSLWNHKMTKTASTTKKSEQKQKKELLELRTVLMEYYMSFLGDQSTVSRSVLRSTSNIRKDTLYACPRIQNEQQSTLPLPGHWLYLPMADEEFSSINTMIASLTFLWKLEIHTDISSLGMKALNKQEKIFAIMRVALSTDTFVFDPMSSTALANILSKYENEKNGENNMLTIEQICGHEQCLALAAKVTRRYLDDPRCHDSLYFINVMKWLVSKLYFNDSECRRLIWSVIVETRLGHTLENVYKRIHTDNNIHSTYIETDNQLIQYYATSLVECIGSRAEYCPYVYKYCVSIVSNFVFGGQSKNSFSRRQIGMSVVRGGNFKVLNAILEYDVKDNKTPKEREIWLMSEE